ncbi:hypothetical protein E0493_12620 [Roseomonas sp. M0104]|uniref:Uncharacterized protein n=1 Tax=Teichococcus coralli TaxID=2545983 RepID=A0A845BFR9_9PROT|nr:hypothetical protein [Pseudoroseomonas coralli]MXP64187.1 hypothetical protein [Pseudoroseomonas coralli]
MAGIRWLLRTAFCGASLGLLLFLVARVMAGNGGSTPLPLGAALDDLALPSLAQAAGLGAGALVMARLLLRPVPFWARRALAGGLAVGAVAIPAFHQSSLFVLHQVFHLVPERGFLFAPLAGSGLPALYGLMLAGALGGGVLALVLRAVHALPDLLTGFLFGALGLSLLSFLPRVPGFGDPWWQWLVINGGWGWGTAFLMRPLALRGGGK